MVDTPPSGSSPDVSRAARLEERRRGSRRKYVIIAIVVVLVLAAGGATAFALSRSDSSATNTASAKNVAVGAPVTDAPTTTRPKPTTTTTTIPAVKQPKDVKMPELDGCQATRRIRKLSGSTTRPWIIALTAGATEADRERALGSGMNDFLTKPARTEQLAAALERAHAGLNGG